MSWTDIASIVFVCVTANHLGLVEAIEKTIGFRLKVVDCPKCSAFWATMAYCLLCDDVAVAYTKPVAVLAISFLASYAAIWIELLEGLIDTLYLKLYGTIITTGNDDTAASDAGDGDSAGSVPEL